MRLGTNTPRKRRDQALVFVSAATVVAAACTGYISEPAPGDDNGGLGGSGGARSDMDGGNRAGAVSLTGPDGGLQDMVDGATAAGGASSSGGGTGLAGSAGDTTGAGGNSTGGQGGAMAVGDTAHDV